MPGMESVRMGGAIMDPIDREGERALTEYLSRHLLALHFPKQDKPEWRSAFYVSYKGVHAVVTAAHELNESHVEGVYGVPRPDQALEKEKYPKDRPWYKDLRPGRQFDLPVRRHRMSPEDSEDVLLIEVDPISDLQGQVKAYDIGEANRDLPDLKTPVFGMGYPGATARVHNVGQNGVIVRLTIQTHATYLRQPESELLGFDPSVHFLMMHNDKKHMDLRGMSGGPIWELPQTPVAIWSPSVARLIGMQIAYYPSPKLLKATKIGTVINLLEEWV